MKCSLIFILCLFTFAGCGTRAPSPPSVSAETTPAGPKLTQRGDAKTPTKAAKTTQSASLPIPAGSEITVNEPQPGKPAAQSFTVKLSAPSVLHIEHSSDSVEAATAFTPPLPPTPEETAKGERVKYYSWAAIVCVLVGGFLLYRTHWMAGIMMISAGAFLHLLGSSGVWVSVGFIGAAIAFVIAWKMIEERKPPALSAA